MRFRDFATLTESVEPTVFVVHVIRANGSESSAIAYTPEEANAALEKEKNAPLEFIGRSGRKITRSPVVKAYIEEAPARLFPSLRIG